MGIIKAVMGAVGGGLADQWLEVIEAGEMNDSTIMTMGTKVRSGDKRSSNTKGTEDVISDGSIIQVYPNQFMMLVDGGKVVDYTAEPGYFKVSNGSAPSLFNGQFGETLKETFSRVKYGGVTPATQKAFFINLKEIRGIKFGTPNPLNYFDNFYNAELFLRTFGTYSIKVEEPLKFFTEVVSYSKKSVDINDINEQFLSEFLTALQSAMNQMSVDGIRISHVASKGMELSKYMADILDEEWLDRRGMAIKAIGISSISYDEESKKLLAMRSQGAMLGDAAIREGFVQGSVARGIEAAGSNANGAMTGFMGVGMGMQGTGGFMSAASATNAQQMQQQVQQQTQQQVGQQAAAAMSGGWVCVCGHKNTGKFCAECGKQQPVSNEWVCSCGHKNTGKFCAECGKPAARKVKCDKCGFEPDPSNIPKFCPECGDPINEADYQ